MYDKEKTLAVDRAHIWHPYTQMKDYADRDPIVMVSGRGVKLYDADGTEYYDTIASWWCNVHGHGNPYLNQGISQQLNQLAHTLFAGITHPPAAELIDRLQAMLNPALRRFFFSDNGATSNEVALKMAFQYWQNRGNKNKTRFVFLENAYHGDTAGAMSVGGVALYHKLYAPLRFKSFQSPSPNCRACPHRQSEFTFDARETGCQLECFDAMQQLIEKEHTHIAAVIVEPLMQGAAGISFYPPEYLQKLRALTQAHNVLLIFDEVATGFGRTGTMFAYEQAGVVPDILCMSKGLTAGYLPLALTVTTETIFQAFYSDDAAGKTFFHGHTYTANPLACSAAIENLKLFEKNSLPQSQSEVLAYFHSQLRQMADFDFIGDIRYLGFIGAVDIVRSRKDQLAFDEKDKIGFQIYLESLKNNLLLRPLDNTIYWFLPLVVTKEDVDTILSKSRDTLKIVIARIREQAGQ
ncbi:adenosylmethionine--8-amino-7-oxononanoate transaminase [bacterium]|nr:adenosylmethionine--8-amino-7-oxononanoate transaminase [bacterium]